MGEQTAIGWTDATWNPHSGCHPISCGCDNCYAAALWKRFGRDFATVKRASRATFEAPLRWHRRGDGPKRIFVCSVSDFCHRDADPWRAEEWDVIRQCPRFTFQVLTKRPGRLRRCLPDDWHGGWPHVWLGVTAENNDALRRRARVLLDVPAAVRFLSIEPMVERIDAGLLRAAIGGGIGWVIVGGESGGQKRVRPFSEAHAREVVDVCVDAGVPVFVKQLGSVTLPLEGGVRLVPRAQLADVPAALDVRQWPAWHIPAWGGGCWLCGPDADMAAACVGEGAVKGERAHEVARRGSPS